MRHPNPPPLSADLAVRRDADAPRMPRWLLGPLALVILTLIVGRFMSLGTTPNGFYLDEAAIATQVVCLEKSQADFYGTAWPLYAPVLAGGYASAPLLYPATLWTKVFGSSEAALRAFAGMHGLLAALAIAAAVGLTTRRWLAATLTLLLGLSSPWLFALSRVFWDPIVGVSWFAVALSAYWVARQADRPWKQRALLWSIAGIAGAAAAYAYPPVRIQLVVSGVFIALLDQRWRRDPSALFGIGWLLVLGTPLAMLYLKDASFSQRGNMLAIWNASWLGSIGAGLEDVPGIFLRNLLAHLDLEFLFWRGDINLRHNSGYGGVIGPTEILALLVGLALALRFVCSRDGLLLLCLFVAALLPAALTRDYIPHTLRSLGAVAPLLLFLGLAVSTALQSRPPRQQQGIVGLLLITAGIWAWCYGSDYFGSYHERSQPYFAGAEHAANPAPHIALSAPYYLSRLGQPLNCPGPQ
ncbi:MAG: hypothetical protein M3O62_06055 [Pseudomonadota bacterium]|nr:hypothetical protein [Pseudomonadota bacterium]